MGEIRSAKTARVGRKNATIFRGHRKAKQSTVMFPHLVCERDEIEGTRNKTQIGLPMTSFESKSTKD